MFQTITKDNWLLFAQKHYDNPTLEKEAEFYDDLKDLNILKDSFVNMILSGNIKGSFST